MRLALPAGPFTAYLFDCDGTIADSMPMHFEAWTEALAKWGAVFTEEQFYAWGGRSLGDIVGQLNAEQGLAMPVDEVVARKEEAFQRLMPGMRGVPEVMAVIAEDHGKVPFAVVSGSPRESVEASLTALGVLDKFPVMVCAGEAARGKPAPDPFLRAAELLGVEARGCLVFEDAELGIESARAAGMQWVKVAGPLVRNGRDLAGQTG